MRGFFTSIIAATLVATPAHAADWRGQAADVRAGAFVGARIQTSLGGKTRARPHAMLTIAPTQSRIAGDGMVRTRIGEGVALDLSPGSKPALTLVGKRADFVLGLRSQGTVDAKTKLGLSTGAWIGIGVVAVAGTLAFLYFSGDCDGLFNGDRCTD